jgi:hypothetical protein
MMNDGTVVSKITATFASVQGLERIEGHGRGNMMKRQFYSR